MTGQTPGSADAGIKKVFATALTETKDYDAEGLGTIRFEGNRVYKWLKYVGGTAAVDGVAGDAVFYSDPDGYKNHEVRQDVTDLTGNAVCAGTLQAAIDISTFTSGAYCWVQIKGQDTLALAIEDSNDGTPVSAGDGDPLTYGDADGALRRADTVHNADAGLQQICGYAGDASDKEVILDCPF